jgi:hypothetical protein
LRVPAELSLRGYILLRGPIVSHASGLCCCRSARSRCPAARRCRRARCRGLPCQIAARARLSRLGKPLSTAAAGIAAGDLRLLLRWSRRGPRRRRVPRHGRSGRAAGGTGRLLRRNAGRLRGRALRGRLRRRVTRRGNLRRGSWRGDVRSGRARRRRCRVRCGRRRVRCGRRRSGSCVRRRGGARGRRSSSLVFLRLRDCGCRNRSRNDKKCCDADVPLQHDTASYVARTSQPARWYAGSACASTGVQRSGAIVAIPILSGLHHRYVRM